MQGQKRSPKEVKNSQLKYLKEEILKFNIDKPHIQTKMELVLGLKKSDILKIIQMKKYRKKGLAYLQYVAITQANHCLGVGKQAKQVIQTDLKSKSVEDFKNLNETTHPLFWFVHTANSLLNCFVDEILNLKKFEYFYVDCKLDLPSELKDSKFSRKYFDSFLLLNHAIEGM